MPTPGERRRADGSAPHGALLGLALPLLVWLLLTLGLFDGVFLRGETFFERDLAWFHRPFRTLLVRLWHDAGSLPLWNPLSNMGKEFAANPHYAVFHPLSWLFFVLPWEVAFRLQVILPLLGAGAAMFFLLRTLGAGRLAAHAGALAWAFGGTMLSLTNLLPVLLTVAPAPAVAAFGIRVVRGRGPGNAAGLALCTALTFAGGEPVAVLVVAALALTACAVEVAARRAPGARGPAVGDVTRPLVRLAAATVLGAAVAAVVIVPGLRLGARSARVAGLTPSQASDWSLPPFRLVELVVPLPFGSVRGTDPDRYWGGALYPVRRYPFVFSIYPGLLVAGLALAALGRRAPGRVAWPGVALVGALLAMGAHTPFWEAARAHLPFFAGLRFPEKLVIVPAFAVVILATGQLDALLRDGEGTRRTTRILAALVAANLAVAAAVVVAPAILGAGVWTALGVSLRSSLPLVSHLALGCGLAGVIGFASWLALRTRTRTTDSVAVLLVALLAADLLVAGRPVVSTESVAEGEDTELARVLQGRPGPTRVFNLADWQNMNQAEATAPSAAAPARWGLASTFEVDYDFTQPTWSVRATRLFWNAVRSDPTLMAPLLARRGTTIVLQQRKSLRPEDPAVARGPHLVEVVPVHRPRPDVACADRVVRYSGDGAWLAAVKALGAGVRDAVLVEGGDAGDLPEAPAPCSLTLAAGRPGTLIVEARGTGPGPSVLAVNQVWHPGWRALLDGVQVPLLRVDVDLCAVVLPPGPHRVELTYHDPALAASLVVSVGALAAVGALLALAAVARATNRTPNRSAA